ncbi:hypothetical protein BJX62DRAFT_10915 [Aspergillus germanicus]
MVIGPPRTLHREIAIIMHSLCRRRVDGNELNWTDEHGSTQLPLLESMNLRSRSMSRPMIDVLASGEGKRGRWRDEEVGKMECRYSRVPPAPVLTSESECPPAAAEWRAQHPPNGSSVPRSSPSSTASSPAQAALFFFFFFSSSCLILILLSTARTQLASLYLHSAV